MNIIGTLPHQKEFALSSDRYTAIVGGFRSGKTRAILYKYIYLSVKRKGKVKLLIIAPTYRLLSDVDVPLFTEYFDEKGIKYTFNKQDMRLIVHNYVCGEIFFRSGDNPRKIVGFEATDFIIDEFDTVIPANQKELWTKAVARISGAADATGGIVTTPEGFKYTHELFVEKKIGKLIKASTKDNHYIPESYIQSLYDNYDSQLVKQYIEGEFVNLSMLKAYYSFDRKNLIKNYKPIMDEIYVGIDFNVDPMTCTISEQVDGKLYTYDEMYIRNSNTFNLVDLLLDKYPDKNIIACPDMTGTSRKTSAAVSDIQILQKANIRIMGIRNPRVKDRLTCVNNAFDKKNIFIDERCKYLVRDLEQVGMGQYGELDKTNLNLTHISDAYGYSIFRLYPLKQNTEWQRHNI